MSWSIDGFPIDIAVTGKWSRKADVSQYPVERGTNITDHIRVNEPELQFEGIISDTPIGAVAQHPTRAAAGIALAAFQRLDAIQEAGRPVTVECSLGIFPNLALANIDVTRDVKTRKGLKVSVSFTRIRIEENSRTRVLASGGGASDFGLSLFNPTGKEIEGKKKILWRKGRPPGGPAIVGQEVIESRDIEVGQARLFHLNGKPLSSDAPSGKLPEIEIFFLDWNRDARIREGQRKREAITKAVSRTQAKDRAVKEAISKVQRTPPRKSIIPSLFGR